MRHGLCVRVDLRKVWREVLFPTQISPVAFQHSPTRDLPSRSAKYIDGLMYDAVQLCLVIGGQDRIARSSGDMAFVALPLIKPPHRVIPIHTNVFENWRARGFRRERLLVGNGRPCTASISSTVQTTDWP